MKSCTCGFLRQSALAAAIAAISAPASAAFFQLAENNASGIGNAYAGGAAIAEDASTVWYNPAGMTRFTKPEFVFAGHFIKPSFTPTVNSASTINFGLGNLPIGGGAGSDPGEAAVVPNIYYTQPITRSFSVGSAVVPNIYYTQPITRSFSVGAGINAPFGLATEYDSTWAGRYHAVRSDIKSVNVNLAGAYKLNETLSGGVGVNYQKLDAELTQAIDFATLCTVVGGGAFSGACGLGAGFRADTNPNDGKGAVKADSDAWGYNLGLLFQPEKDLRFGIAYRSKMEHKLSGTFDATVPTNAAAAAGAVGIVNSGAKANVTLPATLSLSAYGEASPDLALMFDVTRTYWASLPELRIDFDSTQTDSVVTLGLHSTYRVSFGATYRLSSSWVLRGGLAADQSPVTTSADRTPRLPDADRTWYALGAGFQASPALNFDFGYVYIKVSDSIVNKTAAPTPTNENFLRGNLNVNYSGSVQVLSAQARWAF